MSNSNLRQVNLLLFRLQRRPRESAPPSKVGAIYIQDLHHQTRDATKHRVRPSVREIREHLLREEGEGRREDVSYVTHEVTRTLRSWRR